MPHARAWRRGQSPQPCSGAPKAQGLTAAIAVAAPSDVAFFALKATSVDGSIGTSDTSAIYTTLTDVTFASACGISEHPAHSATTQPKTGALNSPDIGSLPLL